MSKKPITSDEFLNFASFRFPKILPRLTIFDLETFPASGPHSEHKCCLIVALFELELHGNFAKIAFGQDSHAAAVPGYMMVKYFRL